MTTHCKNTQSVITTLRMTISSETACFFLLLGFKVLIGGLREQITKYILFSGMEWQDWMIPLMDVNGSTDRKQNYNIVSKTQTMAFNHYTLFYLKITFQRTSSIKSTINLLIQDICMILIKRWNLIYIEITSKDTWHSSPNNFMLQLHVFGDEENRSHPSISVFIGEAIIDRWALNHLVEWRVSEVCCSGR